MTSVKVRIAGLNHVNGIYELNRSCLPVYYGRIEHGIMIMNPSNLVLVAESNDNKIVGYLIGEYVGNNFHIISIGVDMENRNKGIGGYLLKKCIEKLQDILTITLNVHTENNPAISFYMKNDFQIAQIRKEYYKGSSNDKITDAYYMIKKL